MRVDGDQVIVSVDGAPSVRMDAVASEAREMLASLDISGALVAEWSAAAAGIVAEARLLEPIEAEDLETRTGFEMRDHAASVHVRDDRASQPLQQVLATRRSSRRLDVPVDLSDLGAALVRCGRTLGFDLTAGDVARAHRPMPSAGGRHPIRLGVLANSVPGLISGLWAFDPNNCRLYRTPVTLDDLVAVRAAIRRATESQSDPAVVIVLVADFGRTLKRYPYGASLVWRDAGVVAAGLSLAMHDLGVDSCIVGTAGQVVAEMLSQIMSASGADEVGPLVDVGMLAAGGARHTVQD